MTWFWQDDSFDLVYGKCSINRSNEHVRACASTGTIKSNEVVSKYPVMPYCEKSCRLSKYLLLSMLFLYRISQSSVKIAICYASLSLLTYPILVRTRSLQDIGNDFPWVDHTRLRTLVFRRIGSVPGKLFLSCSSRCNGTWTHFFPPERLCVQDVGPSSWFQTHVGRPYKKTV